jgi:hypothetical protein
MIEKKHFVSLNVETGSRSKAALYSQRTFCLGDFISTRKAGLWKKKRD